MTDVLQTSAEQSIPEQLLHEQSTHGQPLPEHPEPEQLTPEQSLHGQPMQEPATPGQLFPQQRLPDLTPEPEAPAEEFEPIVPASPEEAVRIASEVYQRGMDWVSFYREVCGVGGIIRRMFPDEEKAKEFKQTPEFAEIQRMMAKLRERPRNQNESDEPTRVITVRLPQSLHESLRCEANESQTSMNQLCISKLLQIIDDNLMSSD